MDVAPLYHHIVPMPAGASVDAEYGNTTVADMPGLVSVALVTSDGYVPQVAVSLVYLPTRAVRQVLLDIPVPAGLLAARPLSGNRLLITFRRNRMPENRFDPNYLVVLDCNTMRFGPVAELNRLGDTGGFGVYGILGMHQVGETEWTAVAIGLRNPPLSTSSWGYQSPLAPDPLPYYPVGGDVRWFDGYQYDLLSRRVSIRGTVISVDYSPWVVAQGFTSHVNPYLYRQIQNHLWISEYSWTDESAGLSTVVQYQDKARNHPDYLPAPADYDPRGVAGPGETNWMAVQIQFEGPSVTGVHATPLRSGQGQVGFTGPKYFQNGQLSTLEWWTGPWSPQFGQPAMIQPSRGRPGTTLSPLGPLVSSGDVNYYRGGMGVWDMYRWRLPGPGAHVFDYPVTEGDWSGERWIDFRVGGQQGRIRSSRLDNMPRSPGMEEAMGYDGIAMPSGFADLIYTRSGCFVGVWYSVSNSQGLPVEGRGISVFKVGGTDIDNLMTGAHRSKGHFS